MIVEKVLEAKQTKIRSYPVHTNRASELGHECLRYLVLQRTRSNEKVLNGVALEMVFELGNLFEKKVLSDLAEAGITVIEQQRTFEWKEHQITGHCDGKVLIDGKPYPLEIKSSSPYVFNTLKDIDSIRRSPYHYMRKYISQLNLYCLMSNAERGLFLFINKSTGKLKEIWMDVDRHLGNKDLKKAMVINQHVAENTLPEILEWNERLCPDCPYVHICTPDRISKEATVEDDKALEELLRRKDALESSRKKYEEISQQVKEALKEKDRVFIGDYYITGRWQERKDSVIKASRFWVSKIIRVG